MDPCKIVADVDVRFNFSARLKRTNSSVDFELFKHRMSRYTTNQPVTVSENASKFNSHYLLIISRKLSLNLDIPFRS